MTDAWKLLTLLVCNLEARKSKKKKREKKKIKDVEITQTFAGGARAKKIRDHGAGHCIQHGIQGDHGRGEGLPRLFLSPSKLQDYVPIIQKALRPRSLDCALIVGVMCACHKMVPP